MKEVKFVDGVYKVSRGVEIWDMNILKENLYIILDGFIRSWFEKSYFNKLIKFIEISIYWIFWWKYM